MTKQPLKQPLFIASLFFAMVLLFAACQKKDITRPANTNYNPGNGTGTGSGAGTDTSSTDSVASFNAPTGIAVDKQGNIYVADYGNNQIRKISAAGIVTTLAGSGQQGSVNAVAANATFNGPTGVAVDKAGNVYVADDNNNQIRKIATDGTVTTLAGSDSTGFADGTGANAFFFGPAGVAVDAQNNVYVADAGNNVIREIDPSGKVTTIAGNNNPGGNNGAAAAATFNNPTGVALDGSGNIYVADLLNNLIRKISDGQVSTLAGHDTTASIDGTGTAAAFFFPGSVATDMPGNVYVTEYVNNLIRKITPDGVVTTFAGSGAEGQADSTGTAATFNGPSGIAVDGSGNVYVADTYNNVIRKITPAGVVSTIAGSGVAGAHNGKAVMVAHKGKSINSLHHTSIRANNNIFYKIFIKRKLPVKFIFRR